MTAPYVIRDTLGEWHIFDLPTEGDTWGTLLILWLKEGEILSSSDLLAAVQAAIKTAGIWWTLPASYRNIRDLPSIQGKFIEGAYKGDQFEIGERRADTSSLGNYWGKILRAILNKAETSRLWGCWIWLG
jgi:hypothetical protein